MSYRIKDPDTGEFITIANGSRMFVGTAAAIDAAIARGELKYPDLYACTDDYPTGDAADAYETVYRPTSYGTGVQAYNSTDTLSVVLTKQGYKQISGLFVVTETVAGTVVFTLPDEVKSTRSPQIWLTAVHIATGATYPLRMPSTIAYSWGLSMPTGNYVIQPTLYL